MTCFWGKPQKTCHGCLFSGVQLILPNILPFMKKKFFSYKKWDFLAVFLKKSVSDPPTSQKVQQREVQSKSAIRKKSFFHRFRAACKKLEKFIGWVRRTVSEIFFGHIWVEPSRSGVSPLGKWSNKSGAAALSRATRLPNCSYCRL